MPPVIRKVLRRARNFFIGPKPDISLFRRDYTQVVHNTNEVPVRHIYLVPHPTLFRWYENPFLHFKMLGIIELDWLVYTAGLYWKDNN